MVDTPALGAGALWCVGSSPIFGNLIISIDEIFLYLKIVAEYFTFDIVISWIKIMRSLLLIKNIWKLIAHGGDFTVYYYGKDQVIKYSRLSLLLWEKHRIKLIHDYTICKQYLHSYIVESKVISWHSQYIELQKHINWTTLNTKHLHRAKIISQLKEIFDCIKHMQTLWYAPIDLIGIPWLFGKSFTNILVDEESNLKIIDATLLESKSIWILWYIIQPLLQLAIIIQERKIKNILKNSAK